MFRRVKSHGWYDIEMQVENRENLPKRSRYYGAAKEGLEKGIKQGLEQGRTEGEASGRAAEKLEMAMAMKEGNKPVDEISKYTGFSREEINKL